MPKENQVKVPEPVECMWQHINSQTRQRPSEKEFSFLSNSEFNHGIDLYGDVVGIVERHLIL